MFMYSSIMIIYQFDRNFQTLNSKIDFTKLLSSVLWLPLIARSHFRSLSVVNGVINTAGPPS